MNRHDGAIGRLSAPTLVGIAFRCALVCVRPGQCEEAARASCRLSQMVQSCAAPPRLIGEFASWALAIEVSAARSVCLGAIESDELGSDERLAAALVAACQNFECPGLKACAETLLGTSCVGQTLTATRTVAETLRGSDVMLTTLAVRDIPGMPYVH